MALLLSEMGRKNKQVSLLYFYVHNHQAEQLLSSYMLLEEKVLNYSGDDDFLLWSSSALWQSTASSLQ